MKPNNLGGIALIVAIISLGINGYFLYDKVKTAETQKEQIITSAFGTLMDTYCQAPGKSSNEEMVALAKDIPGVEEAKIETEDGKQMLVVGYKPMGANWADQRGDLSCPQ